jgi:3-methyladenine DNA glycosylase/8-oxoguanine DNA glycosylase
MSPDAHGTVELDGPYDVGRSLPCLGTASDPTWRGDRQQVELAGRTPDGPVALRARAVDGNLGLDAWGPGAGWMLGRLEHLAARHDDPRLLRFDHPVLDEVNRRHAGMRHAPSGLVVDGLLARILGQRVLTSEAARSWNAMCRELGGPAPGPLELLLPPDPERLAEMPGWWFHERGVERGRARTMVAVCRNARRLAEVVDLPLPQAYGRMRAIPGLGPWTVNGVARVALGDPDAIVVGDYWISHTVCSFFTGRARGSDQEMLQLVDRWVGQRGRVERLVHLTGHRIQRFAPGVRTPRIAHL